jgi:hypothetical protein
MLTNEFICIDKCSRMSLNTLTYWGFQLSETIRAMFNAFDTNQDGLLEQTDLRRAFASMVCHSFVRLVLDAKLGIDSTVVGSPQGRTINDEEMRLIVEEYDVDKNNSFDGVNTNHHFPRNPSVLLQTTAIFSVGAQHRSPSTVPQDEFERMIRIALNLPAPAPTPCRPAHALQPLHTAPDPTPQAPLPSDIPPRGRVTPPSRALPPAQTHPGPAQPGQGGPTGNSTLPPSTAPANPGKGRAAAGRPAVLDPIFPKPASWTRLASAGHDAGAGAAAGAAGAAELPAPYAAAAAAARSPSTHARPAPAPTGGLFQRVGSSEGRRPSARYGAGVAGPARPGPHAHVIM